MNIFKIENNMPVENIDQTHQFHTEGDEKSSSQEAAETAKLDEQTDNSATAEAIDGEKAQENAPAERTKEDFLKDLIIYRHATAKDRKWNIVSHMMEMEAKLRGWLGNKVSQRPTGNIGEYNPSMDVFDAVIIDSDQTE